MRIPLNYLKPENEKVRARVMRRISQLLDRSFFVEGEDLASFEKNFAAYCGTDYCHGVGSGTDALRTALLAIGVGPGDEVITTPFTYVATSLAIAHVGARPVFVDVGKDGNMNSQLIESAITKRTKAILPVHMYGNPCDMDAIKKIAKKNKLLVIDDCSHAQGTQYKNKKVGSLADVSCFSLYPSKNLGAWGDAGVITTNNKKIAERVYLYKNYGEEKTGRNYAKVLGYNSKLDPIQAIVLDEKLKYLDVWNARRRDVADWYRQGLENIPNLQVPLLAKETSYYVFPVLTSRREALRSALSKKEIETGIHYPQPMHLEEAFSYLGYKKGDFPQAEYFADHVMSLPMFPSLSKKEQKRIMIAVSEIMR